MPAKGYLSLSQKKKLQLAIKTEEDAKVRERILMLLLLNDGKTYQEIADFLGVSLRRVAYWCVHGDPDNLETLEDGRKKGNFKKATQEYIKLLLEVVEKEPQDLGYEFGRWTGKRLADHLEKETGIKLSKSQVSRILAKEKYVYIWGKSSLEEQQDQKKRAAFKEKLAKYLKLAQEKPESIQVWFWDECGFSLRVIRRRCCPKKGKRKKVKGQRRRGRVNMMGGLRYSDKKRICFVIKKGDSETFYEQLKQLNKQIQQEGESQGNNPQEFRQKGPKIVIILDNASFHKKQEFLDQIEAELPKIKLEFLPAYSPDYNLIELVWHSAKEYIAHREFETKEELEKLVKQLLNEGELVINWTRKLKNKGNAINVI